MAQVTGTCLCGLVKVHGAWRFCFVGGCRLTEEAPLRFKRHVEHPIKHRRVDNTAVDQVEPLLNLTNLQDRYTPKELPPRKPHFKVWASHLQLFCRSNVWTVLKSWAVWFPVFLAPQLQLSGAVLNTGSRNLHVVVKFVAVCKRIMQVLFLGMRKQCLRGNRLVSVVWHDPNWPFRNDNK